MGRVMHYVQQWLPLSAGFVHDHVVHGLRPSVVVSRDPLDNEAAFPGPRVISLAPWLRRAPGRLHDPWTPALSAIAVARRVRLVHVHFGYVAPEVLGVCRRLRLPLVLSLHGDDLTAFVRANPRHYEALVDVAARVIVPSEFLAERAIGVGFAEAIVVVQPAGIDVSAFPASPLPAAPGVVFVGRFVAKKGIDVLLDAWTSVIASRPDARLHVVGDGPLAPLVAGAPPSVTHERPDPSRRRQQVVAAIRAARIVVTPSRTSAEGDAESLLLVNLEAQASGRALVTTRHGGIPEFVVEDETALLVDEGDPAAIADAIVRLLDDAELCRRLAEAGPAHAAPYDVRRAVARIDRIYDEVLGERRGRR
jgi:glycosyltransferase involved in cell wall biosynthesis